MVHMVISFFPLMSRLRIASKLEFELFSMGLNGFEQIIPPLVQKPCMYFKSTVPLLSVKQPCLILIDNLLLLDLTI